MKLYPIPDIKTMMSCLFKDTLLDDFLVTEATLTTYVTYQITTTLHQEYFDAANDNQADEVSHLSDEAADDPHQDRDSPVYVTWRQLKPDIYHLIRGRRRPLSLHIVLRLPDQQTEGFLRKAQLSFSREDIAGLYLNIRLEGDHLTLTSGSSLRIFTLDHALDHTWDEAAAQLLRAAHISWED